MLFAPKVISIICSLEPQDLVIEWLDEDGGKKKVLLPGKARIINIRAGVHSGAYCLVPFGMYGVKWP